ncbi:MAG: RepB family DNA primase [Oligoflexia bacterium]|nr:RepB family DNA primase [Oligoflexia bacterium]
MSQMYVLHDADPKSHPVQRIHPDQASDWNSRGFGIFQTVNEFRGPRRIANLVRINAWAVDMDAGTKPEMMARIHAGLIPTMVVETKRGYQAYWAATDAKPENWNSIVLDRLVPFYGADPNARDLARILRVPGYMHLKDPADPFMVRKVWEYPVRYTEVQMAAFYPSARKPEDEATRAHAEARRQTPVAGSFWDRVWHLDCEEALTRLSGHPYVGGEVYTFRRNASGTKNIIVNDRGTSCWIDRDGRIGSLSNGGPTIFQWLRWFHGDGKRVVAMIEEIFPECRHK